MFVVVKTVCTIIKNKSKSVFGEHNIRMELWQAPRAFTMRQWVQTNTTEMALESTETCQASSPVTKELRFDRGALINLLAPSRNAMLFFTVLLLNYLSKHVTHCAEASHNVPVLSGAPLWQSEAKRAGFFSDGTQEPVSFQCGKKDRGSTKVLRLMWKQTVSKSWIFTPNKRFCPVNSLCAGIRLYEASKGI